MGEKMEQKLEERGKVIMLLLDKMSKALAIVAAIMVTAIFAAQIM